MSDNQDRPAFQKTGDLYSSSGAYGITPYGTSPYGGSEYEPYYLPDLQYPSDDLQKSLRKRYSEIRHTRLGRIIGSRVDAEFRSWRINFHAIDESDIIALEEFCSLRGFWLLPHGEAAPTNKISVFWVNQEFSPKPIRGGYYDLNFEIEEVV